MAPDGLVPNHADESIYYEFHFCIKKKKKWSSHFLRCAWFSSLFYFKTSPCFITVVREQLGRELTRLWQCVIIQVSTSSVVILTLWSPELLLLRHSDWLVRLCVSPPSATSPSCLPLALLGPSEATSRGNNTLIWSTLSSTLTLGWSQLFHRRPLETLWGIMSLCQTGLVSLYFKFHFPFFHRWCMDQRNREYLKNCDKSLRIQVEMYWVIIPKFCLVLSYCHCNQSGIYNVENLQVRIVCASRASRTVLRHPPQPVSPHPTLPTHLLHTHAKKKFPSCTH